MEFNRQLSLTVFYIQLQIDVKQGSPTQIHQRAMSNKGSEGCNVEKYAILVTKFKDI
jgi:hypothetical protein